MLWFVLSSRKPVHLVLLGVNGRIFLRLRQHRSTTRRIGSTWWWEARSSLLGRYGRSKHEREWEKCIRGRYGIVGGECC